MYLHIPKPTSGITPRLSGQSDGGFVDTEQVQQIEGILGIEAFAYLADLFVTEAKKSMNEIRNAYNQQSYKKIARWSHSMKSSSATVGCISLAEHFEVIELEAGIKHPENLAPMIAQLDSLLKNSLDELLQHIANS